MNEKYYGFEKFCSLLDDSSILKKHSVMGVVKMLQLCIVEIKSDVLKELMKLDNSKIDFYLDSKILEIEKQDYLKEYGIDRISHILENLNVTIDALIDADYPHELNSIIDTNLSWDDYHENFEYLRATQEGLLYYFLAYYAKELITFLKSQKTSSNKDALINNPSITPNGDRQGLEEILDRIFKEIDEFESEKVQYKRAIVNCELNGRDYPPDLMDDFFNKSQYIKWVITENIEKLQTKSIANNYFFYDCAFSVYIAHYEKRLLEFIQSHVDTTEVDFLKLEIESINNPSNNRYLMHKKDTVFYNEYIESENKLEYSKNKKITFLTQKLHEEGWTFKISEDVFLEHKDFTILGELYFEQIEGFKKRISLDNKTSKPSEGPKTVAKQLTTNQSVLLLEALGFFNLKNIKSTSKVKQSAIISKLIGRNEKNINKAILNLEKKPSELGENHQKDIDKIEDILNNLE